MSLSGKIAKESTITFSGMLYGNLNRYLYTALLARWVGVEYLGLYSLANSIMLIGEVLSKMGMETGILRFVSRLDPKADADKITSLIQSAFKMTTFFSLGVMLFRIIGSNFISSIVFSAPPLFTSILVVFAVSIPFNSLTLLGAYASQGYKLLKYKTAVTQFLNPTILLISMIISYWMFSKETAIMAPMIITGVIGFFTMNTILKRLSHISIKGVLKAHFDKDLFSFSLPLMFVAILQTFMHWMDILMLGYFTNPETVGLYHPAVRTAGLLQALLLSFISIFTPLMSNLHHKKDLKKMAGLYQLVSRWLLTAALPVLLLFTIFPQKVMLLFGSQFLPAAPILIILTTAAFIQTILGAAGPTLSMAGFTKLVFRNSLGAFVLNLTLNIVLIPKYGMQGAAIATFLSLSAIGIARVVEVKILLDIYPLTPSLFKSVFAAIFTAAILFWFKSHIMSYHTLLTLFIGGVISVGVYFFILWILKFEKEDIEFIKGLGFIKSLVKGKN
ncbi:MAG: flippase [Candidatus Marinimicrobia bacterium]|nr:flippase [Candidatus Neomarinimicrobiota bacterium]